MKTAVQSLSWLSSGRAALVVALIAHAGLMHCAAGQLGTASGAQPAPAADARKVVKTADDLPRYTYKIEGKASAFIDDEASIRRLASEIRRDLESTLVRYDIQDPTTLRRYLSTLQGIAMLDGRDDDALGFIDRIRDLESKEARKLMSGVMQRAIIAGRRAAPGQAESAIAQELERQLRALPFEKIRETLMEQRSSMQLATPDLVRGQIKATLDPIVASTNGEISSEIAEQMVQMALMSRMVLPHLQTMSQVYAKVLADNAAEVQDIWASRSVTLASGEPLTPVVLGVWDSGTDVSLFKNNLWTNDKEQPNGKDDDGNGFVDDVHGIAFDLDSRPVPSLLFPMNNLSTPLATVQKFSAGMSDLQSNIDSSQARAARDYIRSLKPEQVGAFMEDMSQWGSYMHGTHVAGIIADGNPAARLLVARLEFDHRNIPLNAPSVERARAEALAAQRYVDYFKAHGVRVVNMSWGGSRQSIEDALEMKGVGKDAAGRAEMAREIFKIYRDTMDRAIMSAPAILFVAAAGNANDDSQFSETIPGGLSAPNLITVGAVDQSGKPTGFTTFGRNVSLYASGYQVESFVPGGAREKASGTSMAAPQVANLAGKLLAINPQLTVAQLVKLITETADPMPGNNPGRVLINPKAAVTRLEAK